MRRAMVMRAVAGVLAGGLLMGGCLPLDRIEEGNPLAAFVVFMSYFKGKPMAKVPKPIKGNLDVAFTGSIGGLSGDFSIVFGKYGSFTGKGKIGADRKSATVTAKDTADLEALVHGIILDSTMVDLTVTTASAKIVGRQTTGGVKKSWSGTIKFQGTVVSGGIIGNTMKGTLKSHGHL